MVLWKEVWKVNWDLVLAGVLTFLVFSVLGGVMIYFSSKDKKAKAL